MDTLGNVLLLSIVAYIYIVLTSRRLRQEDWEFRRPV